MRHRVVSLKTKSFLIWAIAFFMLIILAPLSRAAIDGGEKRRLFCDFLFLRDESHYPASEKFFPWLEDPQVQGKHIVKFMMRDPKIAYLYPQSVGVQEGYNLREHTLRVYQKYFDQWPRFDLGRIGAQSGIHVSRLMKVLPSLHDLGKPLAFKSGDKNRQHEFTTPILTEKLHQLGFNKDEIALANALVDNDVIGELLTNQITVEQAHQKIKEIAATTKISVADFFKLQTFYYTIDASSYPKLKKKVFNVLQGKLVPRSEAFFHLEAMIEGRDYLPTISTQEPIKKTDRKIDPKWAADFRKQVSELPDSRTILTLLQKISPEEWTALAGGSAPSAQALAIAKSYGNLMRASTTLWNKAGVFSEEIANQERAKITAHVFRLKEELATAQNPLSRWTFKGEPKDSLRIEGKTGVEIWTTSPTSAQSDPGWQQARLMSRGERQRVLDFYGHVNGIVGGRHEYVAIPESARIVHYEELFYKATDGLADAVRLPAEHDFKNIEHLVELTRRYKNQPGFESFIQRLRVGQNLSLRNIPKDYRPNERSLWLRYFEKLKLFNEEVPKESQFEIPDLPHDKGLAELNATTVGLVKKGLSHFETTFRSTGYGDYGSFLGDLRAKREEIGPIVDIVLNEKIEIGLHAFERSREGIMSDGFHNTFVTGNQGKEYNQAREVMEAGMLGMSRREYAALDARAKPKSALIRPQMESGLAPYVAENYGPDLYVFDLSNIRDRLTWTPGDSLNNLGRLRAMMAALLGAPYRPSDWSLKFIPWKYRGLMIPIIGENVQTSGKLAIKGSSSRPTTLLPQFKLKKPKRPAYVEDYVEAQIWGPLNLDHVKKFIIYKNPPEGAFLKELQKRNIEIWDARDRSQAPQRFDPSVP